MTNPHELPAVLSAWQGSLTPQLCEFLANAGGFSGARFWRIQSNWGEFCLRRWPQEHPTAEHLSWIHAVIGHAAQQSLVPLAVAVRTDKGTTFAEHDEHLWELTPWLPGEPYDFSRGVEGQALPNVSAKIVAAATALARFHASTANFPLNRTPRIKQGAINWGVSPGIAERWRRMQLINAPQLNLWRTTILESTRWPTVVPLALEVLDLVPRALPTIRMLVEICLKLEVALQPCLRDIWSDHILFTGDQVTGMIDYGAMRMDNVTADIARLMGSFAGDDIVRVKDFLWAYNSVRRENLSPEECQLANAFDASQVLFSGLNWIEWIFVDRRKFSDKKSIERRMQAIVARLRRRVME